MSEILKINDLWGGYQEGVDILRGISLEVRQGEAVGIIGLNGSGKSTLGKAIMNMIPFRKGEITFDGEDITALNTNELFRRGISIMQQGGKVFPNLSVWDNLQLATQGKNVQCSMFNVQLAEVIPLLQSSKRELQRQMADKLSGGQKHQLSLAMTLSAHPRLAILDEPSAGLSPKAVEEMYQMLRAIREKTGIAIILIEQNIAKAVEFCERSLLLQQGKLAYEFTEEKMNLSVIENKMFNE
ncbi:MAG: ATP-binding cassette domain-containing protein [Prevotella sp.]|nr:ATP-binding cassette domain-containing protein [Prevotella sp.]